MLRSSLGFHTLTLFMLMTWKELKQLLEHFQKYSDKTGLIKIFPLDVPKKVRRIVHDNGKARFVNEVKANYKIAYYGDDMGMEWILRYNNWSKDFQSYTVEVTINPKTLGEIKDYVTAATYDDMETAITNFNSEAKRISPLLRHFGCYTLKEIHYCINFFLEELAGICLPEKVMKLIRMADIPPHYEEWMEYCDVSHRMKGDPASFYLKSKSVNINTYSKHMELLKRSEKRVEKGLSPIPQSILDSAHNLVRFEVQYKYRKTYTLSNRAKDDGNHNINKYENLLSYDACNETVNDYFNKVVGKGDWYTLQGAIRKIESYHFNAQREKRLVEALQLVNQCRSLAKAKALFQGRNLDAFKRTLTELSELRINPVTIPKEWGVKHIPNLLYTYYDMVSEEKDDKLMREWRSNNFKEYVKEFGFPSD